jgi:hypothetical protein
VVDVEMITKLKYKEELIEETIQLIERGVPSDEKRIVAMYLEDLGIINVKPKVCPINAIDYKELIQVKVTNCRVNGKKEAQHGCTAIIKYKGCGEVCKKSATYKDGKWLCGYHRK